jgi:mono/diheme cytochrome c family protein
MRKLCFLIGAMLIASLASLFGRPNAAQEKQEAAQEASSGGKIPQEELDKKNPVKPTPEGLAAARKIYTYDCAMCHGAGGNGKGDLADSMKLTLSDWRQPTALAGKTDGELFYVISEGRGKMVSEKDRANETMRWNLVNLVRSFAKKESGEKPAS